jgi:hypothetical protein
LVLEHVALVSGCVVILLAWDEPRRKLVRHLARLNVPLVVLVVVDAGGASAVEAGPPTDRPARFQVLEAGRIEEGLARLGTLGG